MQDEISRMPADDEERAEKESSVCCWLPIRGGLGRLRSLNASAASISGLSMQSQVCTLRA